MSVEWLNERERQRIQELRRIEEQRSAERSQHVIGDDRIIWLQESLEVADDVLASGVFKTKRCMPDRDGEYHAYREVVQPIAEYGMSISTISFDYERINCPRFRRCEECPFLIGSHALRGVSLETDKE